MHNQEKGPVTLLYIILTPDHVGIKQMRLTPVYISSHMTLYLWAWEWNQCPALNIPSQSVSPNVTLFLLKSFTLKLMHTVWLPGWTEKIGEAIVKVMWCHESRFTLFLGDEHTVPWREVDKSDAATIIVIIPVPALPALWKQCYDLGLLQCLRSRFSNIICPNMRTAATWTCRIIRFFPCSMERAHSKMTMSGFTGFKLWKE